MPAVPLLAHVQGCLLSLVAIAGIDLFLRYATLKEYKTHSKARWFMLHSLVNFLVAGFSFHDIVMVLKAPICSMLNPLQSWVPSYLAYSLHLYHFIAYTVVRMEDIVHHLLFVGTFGFVNCFDVLGSIVNLLLLFMTGVPGGIDYAMLSLVKIDKFSRLEEKRLNSHYVWLPAWLGGRLCHHVFVLHYGANKGALVCSNFMYYSDLFERCLLHATSGAKL